MKNYSPARTSRLSRFRLFAPILYFTIIFLMFSMVVFNIFMKDSNGANIGLEDFHTMNTGWQTKDGKAFQIDEIDELRTKESDYISIYHNLPIDNEKSQSIIFRSKNCYVTAFVEGSNIYSTDVAKAPFYNHSPGTRWNILTLPPSQAGKTLEIRITQAYEDGRAKVDNFYHGDKAAIILFLIESKVGSLIISFMIIFVAILFLAAWIILKGKGDTHDNSLLWLALFALAASCWCLLETNLLQLFSEHLRLIQLIDNMMLVLGGLPLYLYLDNVYKVFSNRLVRVLCTLNMAYLLFSTLSQLFGWLNYHQTLNGAIVTYAILVVLLVVCLVKEQVKFHSLPEKSHQFFFVLQRIGIILLGTGLLLDLINYLTSDVLDRALFIRLGLLSFIICFGAGNIYQMISLVKKGMESDFISQLAYLDGLTKLGNRTAYIERLEHLKKVSASTSLCLVMFDINNLKQVNDTLGHKSGDDLILNCAEVLKASFAPTFDLYRIGGDEFVALKSGDKPQTLCEEAILRFHGELERYNNNKNREYLIQIAYGAAYCETVTDESVEKLEREADQLMYQRKYKMKHGTA